MWGRRALVSGLIGLVVAVLAFKLIAEASEDFQMGILRAVHEEAGMSWAPVIWMLLLGIGLGLVAVGTRYHPLVGAIPAVLLFLAYLPFVLNLSYPSWYPDWLNSGLLKGFGPAPFLVIGILVCVSGWRFVDDRIEHR